MIPHVFIKGTIKYNKKDPNQVIILINDPNRWLPVNVAKIYYNVKKLSNTLNFKDNVYAGFSIGKIEELIINSVATNFDSTCGKFEYVAKEKAIVEPQSITIVTMVESSTLKTKPKPKRKLWKQPTTKEKRQKIVDNQALHKMPKGFNLVKCQKINNVMAKGYDDYFPLGIEAMKGVDVVVQRFIIAPQYNSKSATMLQTQDQNKGQIHVLPQAPTHLMNPENPNKVYPTKPMN